ncbi:MAG: hypothetical protein AAGI66_02065 [Cyanobacteria bacterium P01_H01_bin.74]
MYLTKFATLISLPAFVVMAKQDHRASGKQPRELQSVAADSYTLQNMYSSNSIDAAEVIPESQPLDYPLVYSEVPEVREIQKLQVDIIQEKITRPLEQMLAEEIYSYGERDQIKRDALEIIDQEVIKTVEALMLNYYKNNRSYELSDDANQNLEKNVLLAAFQKLSDLSEAGSLLPHAKQLSLFASKAFTMSKEPEKLPLKLLGTLFNKITRAIGSGEFTNGPLERLIEAAKNLVGHRVATNGFSKKCHDTLSELYKTAREKQLCLSPEAIEKARREADCSNPKKTIRKYESNNPIPYIQGPETGNPVNHPVYPAYRKSFFMHLDAIKENTPL